MKFSILIVDDDKIVCNSLKRILGNKEYTINTIYTAKDALEEIYNNNPDLVILDYKLPDKNGLEVLKELKEKVPHVLVIILTAYGNVLLAVGAMKYGAYDFIEKEAEPELVRFTVQKALDTIRLQKEVQALQQEKFFENDLNRVVSNSAVMKKILELAGQFAQSNTTVLLTGETGTGKSLIAEYIHHKSQRFNQPFLTVNCSAIPHELIESELFGYEKGAFTGARSRGKIGLIEKANNGTIFLDEIGELSLDLQAKLLHVLEKSEFFRVGGVESIQVNIRFIIATNADLNTMINENRFRNDLYYRINVASLHMPPVRERQEDIISLAKYFINHFNKKFNKNVNKISSTAETILNNYYWPGNIREIRNIIERVMILIKDSEITENDLCQLQEQTKSFKGGPMTFPFCVNLGSGKNLLHEVQTAIISHTLKIANNNKTKAAQFLGIPRTSLQFYIDKYEILKDNQIT
ncbi:hypothetical protein B6I21_06745 [candidate division KSB1 bacterium 4572_119]|nr:MAG: hypothetical protein B6I21_06745 [candidate division KSB1 bacterium 4572_119]